MTWHFSLFIVYNAVWMFLSLTLHHFWIEDICWLLFQKLNTFYRFCLIPCILYLTYQNLITIGARISIFGLFKVFVSSDHVLSTITFIYLLNDLCQNVHIKKKCAYRLPQKVCGLLFGPF